MTPGDLRQPIVSIGMVPAGASGVRDYGRLLAEELRRDGRPVKEIWIVSDGVNLRRTLLASFRCLGAAFRVPRRSRALWHYSSFAYALRGVPMIGVLLGLLLRARGIEVLTVLHEPAYPWGRRGLRGRAQSLMQRAALPVVLMGSTATVVTTARRAAVLERLPSFVRRPTAFLPVFSTIEAVPPPGPRGDDRFRLGLLGYSGDGARPDLLLRALLMLDDRDVIDVLALGSPGPLSPEGCEIRRLAAELGLQHAVEFTGVIANQELSRRLQECDLVLVLNNQGPSSRRTTVAGPLAHGMAMICIEGPDGWERLQLDQAAVLVPPDVSALATAIRSLLHDPAERLLLGARARRCYQQWMGVERVARDIGLLLDGVPA